MIKILMIFLAVCLVKVDVIKVPSRPPMYPSYVGSMTYDSEHDTYWDRGMSYEAWCKNLDLSSSGANIAVHCKAPVSVPSKNKLIVELRYDVLKDDSWKYATAGVIYSRQVRKPEHKTDSVGKSCYTFDCTTQPFTPPSMEVVMHNGGKFEWDSYKIKLYLPEQVQGDGLIRGFDFVKNLANQIPLNGTALEYLLSTPRLIPREWYGKQMLFLGTIYKDTSQAYYGSILSCDGKQWQASFCPLDYEMYADSMFVPVLL